MPGVGDARALKRKALLWGAVVLPIWLAHVLVACVLRFVG